VTMSPVAMVAGAVAAGALVEAAFVVCATAGAEIRKASANRRRSGNGSMDSGRLRAASPYMRRMASATRNGID
jgi:hypothetical protein